MGLGSEEELQISWVDSVSISKMGVIGSVLTEIASNRRLLFFEERLELRFVLAFIDETP